MRRGVPNDTGNLPLTAQADKKRHHRSLAEADQGQFVGCKILPREFRVNEVVKYFRGAAHPANMAAGDLSTKLNH